MVGILKFTNWAAYVAMLKGYAQIFVDAIP